MSYVTKEPIAGDQIMVQRKFYEHHGIYIGNGKVIQFGESNMKLENPIEKVKDFYLNGIRSDLNDIMEKASVMETTLEDFLRGGVLMVREYTEEELKRKRSNDEICMYAVSKLGTMGYDLKEYNCEHFSNECAFGEKVSPQVERIMQSVMAEMLKGLFGGF